MMETMTVRFPDGSTGEREIDFVDEIELLDGTAVEGWKHPKLEEGEVAYFQITEESPVIFQRLIDDE